ncbi:MAG: heavy metal translocating P-type ATPase [Arenicellales bacterium]|nr:heavy metal translocating P-type ATPase [Arenicellales bacterium]
MDVPIVVGIGAAFAASAVSTISGQGDVYYDSIVMLVFFVLLARRYEMHGRELAAHSLDRLNTLTPRTVLRLGDSGASEIPLHDVAAGDRLRVLPGESMPVDGTITSGKSSIDESLISGESMPVVRGPGDAVLEGSVNGEQPIEIRAARTAGSGVVAEIRALVDRALYDKPDHYRLVDRVAAHFIAVVLVLAGCSGLIWWAAGDPNWLIYVVSVLIVSCPCALALATPVALAVSTGQSVAEGVLPLRLAAMDELTRADTIVFDKTGTLTTGRLVLNRVVALGELPVVDLRRIASAISQFSEHPVARALRSATSDGRPPDAVVDHATVVAGSGIEAVVDGTPWILGNDRFVAEHCPSRASGQPVEPNQAGDLVTYLANQSGVQAAFVLSDQIRRDALGLVRELEELGVAPIVLSGDGEASTRSVAEAVGITEFRSALSPAGKLDYLRQLQIGGRRVVAVGDGINDAPLLAAADASIAVASATDLAKLSSDFVVLGNKLGVIGGLWHRARRTHRIVRQNLVWAFAYNVTAIPLAALGLVPPWLAAIGMSLSSLLVVANALRLRGNQRKTSPQILFCRASA